MEDIALEQGDLDGAIGDGVLAFGRGEEQGAVDAVGTLFLVVERTRVDVATAGAEGDPDVGEVDGDRVALLEEGRGAPGAGELGVVVAPAGRERARGRCR